MQIPSLKAAVGADEWRLRVDLAACYRLVAACAMSDLIFTHISARVPGPEHHFLINPYGLMFDEITASSLIKVDQDCRKVLDSPFPANPAGFVIHSAVHAPRILGGVAQAMKVQTEGLSGAFVWPALLRKLERVSPGYDE